MMPESERTSLSEEDLIRMRILSPNRGGVIAPEPTCGLWWTLTTLFTALAIGAALGVLLWLVLA